jgi:uncharacterized protein
MGIYDRDYTRLEDATKEGVKSFSSQVYSWMCCGLLVTALISYIIFRTGIHESILPFAFFAGLVCFGIGMAMQAFFEKSSATTLSLLLISYSACQGIFFGAVLPLFNVEAIWSAFAVGGLMFSGAVLYGMLTKSSLVHLGQIMRFALIGLIVLSLAMFVMSFFLDVSWMHLVICYIGLGIFVGLTAYEAQQIQMLTKKLEGENSALVSKYAVMTALQMYINVIMIFWYLLQIFGRRR